MQPTFTKHHSVTAVDDVNIKLRQARHGDFVGLDIASLQIIHQTALVYRIPAKEFTGSLFKQPDRTGRTAGKMQDRVASFADVDDVVLRQDSGERCR